MKKYLLQKMKINCKICEISEYFHEPVTNPTRDLQTVYITNCKASDFHLCKSLSGKLTLLNNIMF